MGTGSVVASLRVVGGDLALDFLNTRSGPAPGHFGEAPASSAEGPDGEAAGVEGLNCYDDVIVWSERVGVLTSAAAAEVRSAAAADPRGARRAFRRAIGAREVLARVFVPLAHAGQPDREELGAVRDLVAGAVAHAELAPSGQVFVWQWRQGADLEAPLLPVAYAAGVLLGSPRLARVKGCAACSFLFVDESKNGSRRWCSMEDCGRAAKIRTYVERRAVRRRAATSLQS